MLERLRAILTSKPHRKAAPALGVEPPSTSASLIFEATDANFDELVLASPVPVAVDFWADWCQPCTIMSAYVGFLAEEFVGQLRLVALDVDENEETAIRFDVMGLPTLIFFDAGVEVERIVGVIEFEEIRKKAAAMIDRRTENQDSKAKAV